MSDMTDAKERLRLTQTDRTLLGLLQQDAWRMITELSAITGVSRATVKDRIEMMRDRGVIKRFTIEIAEAQKEEPACGSAFFLLRLRRATCRLVYAAIRGWPELQGCWSISGDLDMVVLISAASNGEIERLRDRLARHPEVKTLNTLMILREWTNRADQRNAEMLGVMDGMDLQPLHDEELA